MGQRITIVLDDDLVSKLRNIQARDIRKTKKSISFSRILNKELRRRVRNEIYRK